VVTNNIEEYVMNTIVKAVMEHGIFWERFVSVYELREALAPYELSPESFCCTVQRILTQRTGSSSTSYDAPRRLELKLIDIRSYLEGMRMEMTA